jgi:hypothetical protein
MPEDNHDDNPAPQKGPETIARAAYNANHEEDTITINGEQGDVRLSLIEGPEGTLYRVLNEEGKPTDKVYMRPPHTDEDTFLADIFPTSTHTTHIIGEAGIVTSEQRKDDPLPRVAITPNTDTDVAEQLAQHIETAPTVESPIVTSQGERSAKREATKLEEETSALNETEPSAPAEPPRGVIKKLGHKLAAPLRARREEKELKKSRTSVNLSESRRRLQKPPNGN